MKRAGAADRAHDGAPDRVRAAEAATIRDDIGIVS